MLEQVISKLEKSASGGSVPAPVIEECISMLGNAEEYRARTARALLVEELNSHASEDSKAMNGRGGHRVPVDHLAGALRALFQQQDE